MTQLGEKYSTAWTVVVLSSRVAAAAKANRVVDENTILMSSRYGNAAISDLHLFFGYTEGDGADFLTTEFA